MLLSIKCGQTLTQKYVHHVNVYGGNNMGKVTVNIEDETHLKLKLICTAKGVKIKDYVEELLANQIVEDYKHLDIPK